jgi:hypothetical protein
MCPIISHGMLLWEYMYDYVKPVVGPKPIGRQTIALHDSPVHSSAPAIYMDEARGLNHKRMEEAVYGNLS